MRRLHARALERERQFTLAIGIGFIAFAVMLLIASVWHLLHQWASEEEEERAVSNSLFVAWPSFFIFSYLAHVKFQLAAALESKTFKQDAICTIFGAMLAFITGLASTAERALASIGDSKDAFGVVDPLASCLIGLLICGEGMRTVFHNSLLFQDFRELA